jgi:hypothetical protein
MTEPTERERREEIRMEELKNDVEKIDVDAVNFSDTEVLEEAYTPTECADNARS